MPDRPTPRGSGWTIEATLVLPDDEIAVLASIVADRIVEGLVSHPVTGAVQYLTVEEAASYLRWSKDRLYKLTAAGAIPHRKHGNRILLRRDEIDRWLDEGFYEGPRAFRPPASPTAQRFQSVSRAPENRMDAGFATKDTLT